MTAYSYAVGRRAWAVLPRAGAWLEQVRPATVLLTAIAFQWLTTLGLALTVRHNGWLYYQGGDQLWTYTLGWLLGHGQLGPTPVGYALPTLLAPVARFAGPDLVSALPVIVLLDVLVLLPVSLLCIYGIAQRIGGRLFAYWATFLWLIVPFVGIKYTDAGYHQRYTELTLPSAFGLTALADFPSMVAVLISAYFAVRTLQRRDVVDSLACGLAAGVAIAVKPASALFLAGLLLAFAYRRRGADAALALAGILPSLATLALWKYRGLGDLPLFHAQGATQLALGAHQPLATVDFHRYIDLNWHQLSLNLDEIKEHFWSKRVIEWLVIAGLIGLARRSLTALLLVGGWFAAFIIVKGTYAYANIADASLFRLLMPSYPAFVLMLAALVYLVPRRRKPVTEAPPPRFRRRTRYGLLGIAAVIFVLYPFALIAAASPLRGPDPRAYEVDALPRTVDASLRLSASVVGNRVELHWRVREPWAARVFYRIWRSNATGGGATCTPVAHAPDDCQLTMDDRGAPPNGSYVDVPGRGTWTYRLALAANWLNSRQYGDVYSVGPPITLEVP